jgi:hypothetical protein
MYLLEIGSFSRRMQETTRAAAHMVRVLHPLKLSGTIHGGRSKAA